MSIEKILSISGKPGLYELKSQTRGGFLAESLNDGKKLNVSARHNVSMLSEISIYTYSGEVPLNEVFQKISEKENGKETIDHKKSNQELESYFREILPEFDEDRVYPSDIKKVVQWYNILNKKGISDFSKKEEENEEKDTSEKTKPVTKKETSNKTAAKKSVPKASANKKGGTGKNAATRKV
ncbi:MAG TPA: DUF5606 domain-containing protein [Flavobacteriaceae bacterium]|nr:DUF5606 domain-containing protein [Flavobacteriaceae bacterium]